MLTVFRFIDATSSATPISGPLRGDDLRLQIPVVDLETARCRMAQQLTNDAATEKLSVTLESTSPEKVDANIVVAEIR